jgi:hypothetical protein
VVRDHGSTDPAHRYRALGYRGGPDGRGYWAAHSADGIHWQPYPGNPVLEGGDTCTLSRDPASGEFLAFHKRAHEYRGHVRRLVYLATSPDMQTWSEPYLVMAPDAEDDEATRSRGGICSQFYNMSAFPWGDGWLGLVTHFSYMAALGDTGPGQSPHDGPIEAQLVHSRDGRTWQRCSDRTPIIGRGPHPYDRGCILGVANQPVASGDQMWLYYTAINTTHGGTLPTKEVTVGRASWPRDRWAGLEAGPEPAVVETVPVTLGHGDLTVNASAAAGEIRVEVIDGAGAPVPGCEAHACAPICGDRLSHPVRWATRDCAPTGSPVQLRFLMRRARLFSWSDALAGSPPRRTGRGPA